ncbi:MAG: FAD-binding oxidoreductase [Myxococcales bacterium]|nr:FAD-binding oxidoreductase [Myxococcales bacterium]
MSDASEHARQAEALSRQLAEIVGAAHVSGVNADLQTFGSLEPDMVVWPAAAPEVARILDTCRAYDAAVGVTGARTRRAADWDRPARVRVALNTRRMTNILDLDESALTVQAQCGIRLRNLELALQRSELTLGFYPVQLHESTLGGLLAEPPPTAYTPMTGRMIDSVLGVSVARVDGSVIHTRVAPRRATGPDLARLYLGAGADFGVITGAVLRVMRAPELVLPLLTLHRELGTAVESARQLLALGVRPARLRVLEANQARRELGEPGYALPAVCIAVLAGPGALVDAQGRAFSEITANLGGSELPQKLADTWWAQQREPEREATMARPARGAALRYSSFAAVLAQLRDKLGDASGEDAELWIDAMSLHGLELWAPRGSAAAEAMDAMGLASIGRERPPLLQALREVVDNTGTMLERGPLSEPPRIVGDADVTR